MSAISNAQLGSSSGQRLHVIDILKLCFIVALVIFHTWEYSKYENQMATASSESFYSFYYHILTLGLFRFTGLLLTALSFFLFGYRNSVFSPKKILIFLAGIALIQIEPQGNWSWDVYGFLLISYIICYLIPKRVQIIVAVLGLSLLALGQSAKDWSELLGLNFGFANRVFVAQELTEGPNGWFLFPWIFLPIASYCFGFLARVYEKVLRKISWIELVIWIALLCLLNDAATRTTAPQAGRDFHRYLFWGEAKEFWPNFILLLAIIRVSFADPVRRFFSQERFYLFSKIQWLQNLWICYFVHLMFIFYFAEKYTHNSTVPHFLDFSWVATLMLTEISVQFLFFVQGYYTKINKKSF
jgi:hypothetical protein